MSSDRPSHVSNERSIQVLDFRVPRNGNELAKLLGTTPELLSLVASCEGRSEFYHEHRLVKRRYKSKVGTDLAKFRTVWEAKDTSLVYAHKALARKFEAFSRLNLPYPTAECHGYVTGRSTVTNASVHSGAEWLLRADIQDFFPSISLHRLRQLFEAQRLHPVVSELLSRFSTIDDKLALGLHASPLFANLICLELDQKMKVLADSVGCKFTRYADDLAFSGINLPSRIAIESILESEGFKLSPNKKVKLSKRGQSHYVTGLSISDHRPRVPRQMKKRVRQELYYIRKFGLSEHLRRAGESTFQAGINRIDGTIRYINAVEPDLASSLYDLWKELLSKEGRRPSYGPVFTRFAEIRKLTLYVDEAEVESTNGNVLVLGCALTEDPDWIEEITNRVLRLHLSDPYTSGRKSTLEKKGIHHTDASEELRVDYIRELGHMPFRGYISFDFLPSPDEYESVYLRLLDGLLRHRLMAADRATMEIIVEENSKVSSPKVKAIIDKRYRLLSDQGGRRPLLEPNFSVGRKVEQVNLAVVDFMLALFSNYATLDVPASQDSTGVARRRPVETTTKRFERVRDKVRVISSHITGTVYQRNRPFLPWPGGDPG